MSRVALQDTITSPLSGVAVPSATVTIRDGAEGGALSTLYLLKEGGTEANNPIATGDAGFDANGFLGVYLDPGRYWVEVETGGVLRSYDVVLNDTSDEWAAGEFNFVSQYENLEAALAAGVQLDGQGRTYALTDPITFADGAGLRNAVIDVTAVTTAANEACITSTGGGLSDTTNLTADVATGATTLTMASTAAFSAGERIVLRSNADWSVSDDVPLSEELEILAVATATQITLKSPVLFAYATADTARIEKITRTICGDWENLTIIGNGTQAGALEFAYVDYPKVRNIKASGIDSRNIICTATRCGYIRDCEVIGDNEDDLNYGVLYRDGTIDLVIDNVKMVRGRHTVTGGGTGGVNMRVHCSNIWGVQPRAAVYDQHAGCYNCTAYGVFDAEPNYQLGEDGLVVQGANAVVRGVKVNMGGRGRHSANIQSLIDYGSGWNVDIEGEFHNAVNSGVFFKPEGSADVGRARLDVSVRGCADEAIEAYLQSCSCDFLDLDLDIDIIGSATKQNIMVRQYTTHKFGGGRIVGRSKRANDDQENIQLQGLSGNEIANFTIAAVLENGSHGVRGVDAATGTINTAGNVYIGMSTNEDGL